MRDLPLPINKYKNIISYLVFFFVVVIFCTYAGYVYGRLSTKPSPLTNQSLKDSINYTKKDFQNEIPATFLETIPLPDGISLEQTYELNYASSSVQQATVVFTSSKKVIENYTLYENFLEENEWWLPMYNKRAGIELSSLYANKYDEKKGVTYTINIVIREAEPRAGTSTSKIFSQVSISVATRKNTPN